MNAVSLRKIMHLFPPAGFRCRIRGTLKLYSGPFRRGPARVCPAVTRAWATLPHDARLRAREVP